MDEADIYSLYASRTPDSRDPPIYPPNYASSRGLSGPRAMGERARLFHLGGRELTLKPVEEYVPQPFEDQFATSATLNRHRSTRDLIKRFEAMTVEESGCTSGSLIPLHPMVLTVPTPQDEKKTSPLRQSLRNIISVFKKGRPFKDKDEPLSFRSTAQEQMGQVSDEPSSPHFYVHSVPLRSLPAEEQALMPIMDETWSPNVFEIVFSGKPPARFAVGTAKERSSWVSAIWDASLRANNTDSLSSGEEHHEKPILTVDTSVTKPSLVCKGIRTHKELVPVPPPKTDMPENQPLLRVDIPPQAVRPFSRQNTASPITPITITQRFESLTAPFPPFKVHSPSVLNLSQKSVVKQRLAEMERQVSTDSGTPSVALISRFTTPAASPLKTPPTSPSPSSHTFCGPISLAWQPERTVPHNSTGSVASPTSSVFSGSKSAFRIRDEMRKERCIMEQAAESNGSLKGPLNSSAARAVIDRPNASLLLERVDAVGADVRALRMGLEDMAHRETRDLKQIEKLGRAVGEIRKAVMSEEEIVLKNEKPGSAEDVKGKLSAAMQQALEKLDIIGGGPDNAEIMAFLRDDQAQRTAQVEQQADNARYLNELNGWLDTFARNNAAHVESISEAVQRLCHELDVGTITKDGVLDGSEPPTLLASLRHLIVQGQAREQESEDLRQALGQVIALLNEDMRLNAEMRNAYTSGSVQRLMDGQRQELEQMVQTLETRLSEEIRGSRLRFIEAMKEATEISIQGPVALAKHLFLLTLTHILGNVDELKRAMMKETLLQTREASRAQRRRQALDKEVAEMLALRASLKQNPRPVDVNDETSYERLAPEPERARSVRPGDIVNVGGLIMHFAEG
ncbi:hypothetical protein K488DRAFT_81673 [Vararia minispora EC-137]|uniref:Uncharacterized protein n=1 Tax=Vararia minispora EC-137 TaxID=1314806 RepID=A0ACB8QYY8_9AGAM|nr:hypothetical protein K488DRAFT_81673 [Vararia minispora EC-137]